MTEADLANFFVLDKRVHVEFINADMDGYEFDSDEGPAIIRHFVKQLYVATDDGTVGKYLNSIPLSRIIQMNLGGPVPTEYKVMRHRYTIVEREEHGAEVLLRVRHSVRTAEECAQENPD